MKRAALMLAVTLFTSLAATAPANAQTFGQVLIPNLAIPIVGSGTGAGFNGTFTLRRFVRNPLGPGVAAVGTLTGILTTGSVTTAIVRNLTIPVLVTQQAPVVAQALCPILHLDLAPLALDLLGLQVDLSRVVLDIGAEPGPGNLLGNLLCTVTGLLDAPGLLARLLNQILGLLG